MTIPTNKSILSCARGERPWRYPIWFLRQAGRYLPEYRAVRAQTSFLELCGNPHLAAEVSLQPLKRFDLDGAIIFSDILVIPHMLGQELRFGPGEGPQLSPPIRSSKDLLRLKAPAMTGLVTSTAEALTLVKPQLQSHHTLIGFAGAPCTVACYMIEGSGSTGFNSVKQLLMEDPSCFHTLLDLLAEATYQYLRLQVQAGADVLMLFDTWAGHFSRAEYLQWVAPVTARLLERIRNEGVPVIYYPGQGSHILTALDAISVDVLAVDWRIDCELALRLLGEKRPTPVLQGNLDPLLLSFASEAEVRTQVRRLLAEVKRLALPGHIFNVGHGLLPTTRPEAVTWVIDEIRNTKG